MSRPKVSFVVPTLNRGRHVERAVASCLATGDAAAHLADIEVVVLDSQSDDGSWERLCERFGSDPRVKLSQNARGLGPTRSWLDGVALVTGDYATFLWSDDYVDATFLPTLLPPLLDGAALVSAQGIVRDIDDERPLPVTSGAAVVPGELFIAAQCGLKLKGVPPVTVSPAAALFPRAALDRWQAFMRAEGQATPLRQKLWWKRAIGPDLLLFLIAADNAAPVRVTAETVVQFSAHAGSITISSTSWRLRAGYWLARVWAWSRIEGGLSTNARARTAVRLLAQAAVLQVQAASAGADLGPSNDLRAGIAQVAQPLWQAARDRLSVASLVQATIREGGIVVRSRMARLKVT